MPNFDYREMIYRRDDGTAEFICSTLDQPHLINSREARRRADEFRVTVEIRDRSGKTLYTFVPPPIEYQDLYTCGDKGIEHNLSVVQGTPAAELAARIWAEQEGPEVQAEDMVRYFPGKPKLHTTTSLYAAMLAAGCEVL